MEAGEVIMASGDRSAATNHSAADAHLRRLKDARLICSEPVFRRSSAKSRIWERILV